MAASKFAEAMKIELVFEGGKVDDPKDPGGRTNQGVTQRVYTGYRKRLGSSIQDVYLMADNERDAIYKELYWDVIKGDQLPEGIDIVVFDGAINSGTVQSAKWLQRGLQAVGGYSGIIDGNIGPATLAAIDSVADQDKLIAAILDRRLAFLQHLTTWRRFSRGWTDRVNQTRRIGQAWAIGSVGPAPVVAPGGATKALIEDAKPRPTLALGDASTGAGGAAAVATGYLTTVKDSLTPIGGTQFVDYALAAIGILSATAAAAGLAWRWYATRKSTARADALDLPSANTFTTPSQATA